MRDLCLTRCLSLAKLKTLPGTRAEGFLGTTAAKAWLTAGWRTLSTSAVSFCVLLTRFVFLLFARSPHCMPFHHRIPVTVSLPESNAPLFFSQPNPVPTSPSVVNAGIVKGNIDKSVAASLFTDPNATKKLTEQVGRTWQ